MAQTWLHMVAAANAPACVEIITSTPSPRRPLDGAHPAHSLISTQASTAGRLAHGMFMAKGAIDTGLSPKTRSLLYVGAPLEGFASTTDRTAEQYDTYQEYVEKVETKLMAHFGVSGSVVRSAYLEPWIRDDLEFKAFSYLLQRLEWLRLQEMDSLWMAITICFVALWIRVHTGSLKFAAAATCQILLSIPVTALIYRYIIGFEYFAFLHLCSIFVVLGIGADDNFVLLDAWRQASNDVPSGDEVVLRRLLYAFDRARDAIFNTSLTGGAATTLGAAALMLPCQLTFFYKLGLLIFTTIFCSLVFAFGFVMPLLAAAGPSGDWCGFSLPGQKRHHGGRVAAAPLEATPAP